LTTALSRLRARFTPSLVGLAAFLMVCVLWLTGEHIAYTGLLFFWGIVPFRFPFIDVNGSLAAWDCARLGVDVIISDPCDVLKRPYNYSPFWMSIHWIPLGQGDRIPAGLTLGIGFLLSLAALPPSKSAAEVNVRILCVLSTMVVFALERANPDLLIFLLVLLALWLLRASLFARLVAYGVIFIAGAIKYYPFVLLSLIGRERIHILIPSVIGAVIGLLVFDHIYDAQIREGLPGIARGLPFGDVFGAANFFQGIVLAAGHATGSKVFAVIAATIARIVLIMGSIMAAFQLWKRSNIPAAIDRLDEDCRLTLMAGVLLLSGCFFSGQNVGYRGIFLFFLLPGLFSLAQDQAAGALTRAARWAAYGIPVLMWAEGLRFWIHSAVTGHFGFPWADDQPVDFVIWLMREISWWLLISLCLTLAAGFFAGLPATGSIIKRFFRRRGI
jgi:hypothetical protein